MSLNSNNPRKSSKKRFQGNLRARVRRATPYSTLAVHFPDGSIKVTRPDMSVFDGDWKTLALSLCEGHRVTWVLS